MRDDNSRIPVLPGFVIILAMGAMLVGLAAVERPVRKARVFLPGSASSEAEQQPLPASCSPVWSSCAHRNPA